MFEYLISLAIFYVGVGLLLNSLLTLYLMNEARKDGLSLGIAWVEWFKLSLIWPKTLYKLVEGFFSAR